MRSHTIAIGLFMLAAVTALPHQGADEVVPEMDLAESNLAMEAFMQDQMQATSLYKLSPVTEAIVALKAYSIKAKEVFEDQIDLETATEGASSLVELVQILGVPMPEDGDVVTEFADAVLALRAKGGGLFDYLIKHVNLSVMRGKSPVAPVQAPGGGYFITFSPEVVGLQTMPEYFRTTLAVKGMGYQELKIQIETTVSDEYDPVSESWKLGKVNYARAYDKALLRLKNKWELDKQLVDQMAEAKAQVAIHKKYVSGIDEGKNNMTALHPLPTAGHDEAEDYRSKNKISTTEEEIAKAAAAQADSTMADAAKRDNSTANMLKTIEATRSGTTVRITTGPSTRDISTQLPTITIQGTDGNMDGQLEALPLIGESYSQTFSGKRIGDFLSVRLHVDPEHAEDGWMVSKIEVQNGYGKDFTTLKPITCEGVFHDSVWLNKLDAARANFSNTVHLGGSSHLSGSDTEVGAAVADHASGALVAGAPEWTFIPEGTSAPSCSHFVVEEVSKDCETTCGYKGGEHVGAVQCKAKGTKKIVPDSDCVFWGHKKPAAKSKTCPATANCVKWVSQADPEPCAVNCGFKGDVKKGTVKCTEVVGSKIVGNQKCAVWNLKKPPVPETTCPSLPACVKWATTKPSKTCQTTCGTAATTFKGESFCQEEVSGTTVSDSKCLFKGTGSSSLGSKPTVPTKDCPATAACVKWVQVKPSETCATTCGYAGDTFTGSVKCVREVGGSQVSDSQCNFWELKKPAAPSKTCPAQDSCHRFGVETPAEQGQSCSKKCGHPASTLTGSVTCCKVGPGGLGALTNCTETAKGDACHDLWANAEVSNKPEAPTETCDAAAKCVSFVETSADPCPTSCGTDAVTKKGSVTCHETKSQALVTDAKCFAQNLTKPEVMVRECDATAACPTRNPTAAPTRNPTAAPTAAPTTPTSAPTHAKRFVKIKFIGEGSDTGDCREDWSSEMVMATTFTLGDRSKISQCDYFQCNTDSWCSKELNSMSGDSNGGWKTYTVQPESNGDIPLKFTLEAFEADSSGDSTWKNCVYESGDDCKATIEGSHTFRINSDYFVTSDGKASGSATTKLQGSSSSGHYGNWKMKAQWEIS